MCKRMVCLLIVLGAFGAGSLATAATGWHVFATAQDEGNYGAYASASASASRPHALAVQVSRPADVSWTLSCDGQTQLAANKPLILTAQNAGTCRVYASGSTDTSGTLRVQLLKR